MNLQDQKIIDHWEQLLESMYPEYQKHKAMLEKGPVTKALLTKSNRKSVITIEEIWDGVDAFYYSSHTEPTFDFIVEEVTKELSNWSDVNRIAFNMWQFKKHKDAEKFVTFFNLKWAQ